MPTAYLLRTIHQRTHTLGALVAIDDACNTLFHCVTLELPWLDNQSQVSCIPEGAYRVRTRKTDKFGQHYHVQDVPGREWILFHPANYVSQLRGCIIPGRRIADLNRDGVPDITDSTATLNAMLAALGREFTLHVLTAPVPGGTLPAVTIADAAP